MSILSLIVDGNEFSLDDGTYCRLIGYDGWGSSPSQRQASQGPQQHGDTDEGQFLKPRFGSLALKIMEAELDQMYYRKQELLDLFNPEASLILKWYLPYGVRQFDCFYYEDLSLGWDRGKWATQNVGVVLKCPDPTCYDPSIFTLTWVGSSGSGGAFLVPWEVPTEVGGSTFDDIQTVQYHGTWIEYPLITIAGPAENLVITNHTTGEKLDFTGLTLGAGEQRIIDTRYGFKTVLDEAGANQIADLTDDSDLATFHIERKRPYETFRVNNIQAVASGVDSNTRVIIRYLERYTGK